MLRRLFAPLPVTVAIVIAGTIGATLVFRAARDVGEADLQTYVAWEQQALPALERARAASDALPAPALDAAAAAVAAGRAALDHEVSRPVILRQTVSWFGVAVDALDRAIAALRAGNTEAFAEAHAEAYEAFAAADDAHAQLRERLRLGA